MCSASTETSRIDDATNVKNIKSAIRGGRFAYYVDQFDIFLPVFALAPALIYFIPDHLGDATKAMIAAFVVVSTLIARPLGSLVFGHYADRIGRHRTTLFSIGGFSVTTLMIAVLPGFNEIGFASIVLLLALRFVSGFFLGGEYSTAVPLAMEWSPKNKRAITSGSIKCGNPLAMISITVLTAAILSFMPSDGLDSRYVQWGWRIPFLVGFALSIVLFVYYQRSVHESPDFIDENGRLVKAPSSEKAPILQLLSKEHRRNFGQIFLFMSGVWLLTDMAMIVLPGTLKNIVGFPDQTVTLLSIGIYIGNFCFCIGAAILAEYLGRRTVYVLIGMGAIVVASSAQLVLPSVGSDQIGLALALSLLVNMFVLSLFGPIAAYITERFPPQIRATGYGAGFSLSLIIPSFFPFYIDMLGQFMPRAYAPAVLSVFGGLLIVIVAALGPETKGVDLHQSIDVGTKRKNLNIVMS